MKIKAALLSLTAPLLTLPAQAEINWTAEMALENSLERQVTEIGTRSGAHLLKLNPAVEAGENFQLGISTEGEMGGLWQDSAYRFQNFAWQDLSLYGEFGSYALSENSEWLWRPVVSLPVDKEERELGMQAAPGLEAEVTFDPWNRVSFTFRTLTQRYFRQSSKASPAIEPVEPVSEEETSEEVVAELEPVEIPSPAKFAWENEFQTKIRAMKDTYFVLSAKLERLWLWRGEKEDLLELKQLITYERKHYAIEFGHAAETTLRDSAGVRKSVALFRPAESKLLLNLIVSI